MVGFTQIYLFSRRRGGELKRLQRHERCSVEQENVIQLEGQVMAKKRASKKPAKRSPAKRDVVRRGKASAYAKRTSRGAFREMDDVGRAQRSDRPRKAKRKVKSGYGDQGDRKK